jgi:hypothetical protein
MTPKLTNFIVVCCAKTPTGIHKSFGNLQYLSNFNTDVRLPEGKVISLNQSG